MANASNNNSSSALDLIQREGTTQFLGIFTTLGASATISLICFLLFEYLRRCPKRSHVFSPRIPLLNFNGPFINHSKLFSWIYPTISITEEWLFDNVGMDAIMYLKFLKTSTKLFLFSSTVVSFMLTPIYFFGAGASQDSSPGLVRLTIANLPSGSSLLALPCIFTWYISLLTFYLFHETYKDYVTLRIRYLKRTTSRGDVHLRTVMITGIPKSLRDEKKLSQYFEDMGLGKVERAYILRKTGKIERAVTKREQHLRALEWSLIQTGKRYYNKQLKDLDSMPIHDTPLTIQNTLTFPVPLTFYQRLRKAFGLYYKTPPPFSWHPTLSDKDVIFQHQPMYSQGVLSHYEPVPAVYHFFNKFVNRDEQVMQMLSDAKHHYDSLKSTRVGFVTFESYISANLVSTAVINPDPYLMVTKPAPEPRDILWKNVIVHARQKFIRRATANFLFVILTIFWTIPLLVLVSLANVDELIKNVAFLSQLQYLPEVLLGFIKSLLPALVYSSLMAVLPLILSSITRFEYLDSYSEFEKQVTNRYFIFEVVNVIFLFTLGPTMFTTYFLLNSPAQLIIEQVSQKLLQGSSFYLTYVIFTISTNAMELLQIGSPIFFSFLFSQRFLSPTPRILAHNTLPYSFPYFYYYPNHLLILVLSLFYSIITPVILIFAAIFFGSAYIIFKYQLSYAYVKRYEKGGDMWPTVFRSVMMALICFQVVMIGVLSAQGMFTAAIFLVPLIPMTLFFNMYATRVFKRMISGIPIDLTMKKNKNDTKERSPENHDTDRTFVQNTVGFVESMFHPPLPDVIEEVETLDNIPQNQNVTLGTIEIDNSPVEQAAEKASHRSSLNDSLIVQNLEDKDYIRLTNPNFAKVFPFIDPLEHPYPVRDDISFYQTYDHPIFLNPLAERLWLPCNPNSTKTWELPFSVTFSLESCVTVSDSPNSISSATKEQPMYYSPSNGDEKYSQSVHSNPKTVHGKKSLGSLFGSRKRRNSKSKTAFLNFPSIPSALSYSKHDGELLEESGSLGGLYDEWEMESSSSIIVENVPTSVTEEPVNSVEGAPGSLASEIRLTKPKRAKRPRSLDISFNRNSSVLTEPPLSSVRSRLPLTHTMTFSTSLNARFRSSFPQRRSSTHSEIDNEGEESEDDDV